MVRSKASSVAEYLEELPEERRAVVAAVRKVVKKNMPKGYQETMNWGMICYEIPLTHGLKTYNGQPLMYAALGAQKNYYVLHLMCAYAEPTLLARLRQGFEEAGKKLDMGKGCLRFKALEDLPLDTIAAIVAAVPPEKLIEKYEESHPKKAKSKKKS